MTKKPQKKPRGRQYGILNQPPLIVDFKLNFISGTRTYGVSYSGPLPKFDMEPKEIPTLLRALADKLEDMQNGGPAPSFGEAFAVGMDAAHVATAKRHATKR